MKNFEELTKAFGNRSDFARAINAANPRRGMVCHRYHIEGWARKGVIPRRWLKAVATAAEPYGFTIDDLC